MQMRSKLPFSSAIRRLGPVTGFGLAVVACGSVGDPPSSLPSAGTSSGGTSSGGTSSGGTSNGGTSSGGTSNGGMSSAGMSNGGGAGGEPDDGDGTGECNVRIIESPPTSAVHEEQCTEITYSTTPPSGGSHYGIWSQFQSYDYPVPAGYVVHNLEHGAIVFWYDCPEGCADEVAEVQAFIDGQPVDPLCESFSAERRALLVPYPGLGARWAASAWGYALVADCFDSVEFGAFYTDHYGRAPESLCNDGQVIVMNACP